MITETEAKEKWCPYTESIAAMNTPIRSIGSTVEITGDGRRTPGTFCIGSACMAWRSSVERKSTFTDEPSPGSSWTKDGDPAYDGARPGKLWQRWKRAVGYCGAFGKTY